LRDKGVSFKYEAKSYDVWVDVPSRNVRCNKCGGGKFQQKKTYTPDFFLDNGVIIEAKGRLTVDNRRKYKAFLEQHGSLNFKMMFQRNNPIARGSKTKYSDWCKANGIEFSVGVEVPDEWY
tara:strand:- start:11977 stop:12339 length:363 start_codon:yes stop_codon:yes gene_type:complete